MINTMEYKLNILIDLRKTLDVYEKVFDLVEKSFDFLTSTRLEAGFCLYFFFQDFTPSYRYKIYDELLVDYEKKPITEFSLFYPAPRDIYHKNIKFSYEKAIKEVKTKSLQPRINHLKLTIARLEKELNIESSQSLELKKGKFND